MTDPLAERRLASARKAAKEVFGHDSLRPFQEQVLPSLLSNRDMFAVTATGGGKSLCFQLPALVLPGPAVVVSPLISLMTDQVTKLRALGIRATRLDADVPRSEQSAVLADQDLIYVSPEKLATPSFQKSLRETRIGMIALDEAHAAIEWQDFRGSYAHIRGFCEQHPEAVRFACTATADDEVEAVVRALMNLRDPVRVVTSPWRDNIEYVVRRDAGMSDLADRVGAAQALGGSQIVYAASRRETEAVAQGLRTSGLDAAHYHAGMNPNIRTQVQQRFMRGELRCVCATNAFGMGIDKPDVRLIAHWQMPKSLFAYLQETGRASRDGQPATAWLNMSKDAERVHNFLIELSNPGFDIYQRMWAFLTSQDRAPVRVPLPILARASGVSKETFKGWADSALSYLEFTGHVRASSVGECYELPIINAGIATRLCRTIRGSRVGRGVVMYEVQPGERDMHMQFVSAGACRSANPSDVVSVHLLRRDLTVTPVMVSDKKERAKRKLLMLHRFAEAPDRRSFVEALFVQANPTIPGTVP